MMDALFDTRLAVLYQSNPEGLAKVLPTYTKRTSDVFDGYPDFATDYQNRTKSILTDAYVTLVLRFIEEFVYIKVDMAISGPELIEPEIVINSYPYVLTDSEAETIIGAVVAATHERCSVRMVHMPLEDITPRFLKENVDILVMYEYLDWIDIHAANGNWGKQTVMDVALIVPAISFRRDAASDFKKAFEAKYKKDLFGEIAMYVNMFIAYRPREISFFSVHPM
jgi:hypothetical protein